MTVKVRYRCAAKLDLLMAICGQQHGQAEALGCQVLGVLQAEHGGDAKLLLEPGYVLDPRIFADEEGRQDLAHFWLPAAAVTLLVRKGVIEVSHARRVEEPLAGVKADRSRFLVAAKQACQQ